MYYSIHTDCCGCTYIQGGFGHIHPATLSIQATRGVEAKVWVRVAVGPLLGGLGLGVGVRLGLGLRLLGSLLAAGLVGTTVVEGLPRRGAWVGRWAVHVLLLHGVVGRVSADRMRYLREGERCGRVKIPTSPHCYVLLLQKQKWFFR